MKHKKLKIALIIIAALLLVMAGACGIYLCSYSHASAEASSVASSAALDVHMDGREVLFFGPEETTETAIIFYPGGKVQPEAYAPLCRALADRGFLCALVKMPFNLAVFDVNAADEVISFIEDSFGCKEFYIAGHSLGGAMGSAYAAENSDKVCGIIQLAAYSASDLSGTDLRVLSVYGTEDGVMNRQKYSDYASYRPADFTELIITGGCHSYFGDYGMQKGDGSPTISRAAQQAKTVDAIVEWIR